MDVIFMEKIEKYRKLAKIIQFIGMGIIIIVGLFLLFIFRNTGSGIGGNTVYIIALTLLAVFMFLTLVGAPMQAKLLKLIILESLNGLVSDVKFSRKKGYSRESFDKLNLVTESFASYGCTDYFSFVYKDLLIESTTVRAFDEVKVSRPKGKKGKTKVVKEIVNHFFGRVYIIPFTSDVKYNIYGKRNADITRKKEMADKDYNNELPIKIKKYSENFEVYYKDEKPTANVQALLEKLYYLRLQAKGPVSLFVRKHSLVLCIDNSHYYKEVELKAKVDENLIRDYRKDVSMVLSFVNSLNKLD